MEVNTIKFVNGNDELKEELANPSINSVSTYDENIRMDNPLSDPSNCVVSCMLHRPNYDLPSGATHTVLNTCIDNIGNLYIPELFHLGDRNNRMVYFKINNKILKEELKTLIKNDPEIKSLISDIVNSNDDVK